jgi:predicted permease
MIAAQRQTLRRWFGETHGARFELLRHFLPRFLDSDLIGSAGDWTRVAIGAIAILASSWMLLGNTLLFKYKKLAALHLEDRLRLEVQADLTALGAMSACLTMLLIAFLWQSLYPTLRDYLALAAFPVSPSDIFIAKFSAVGIAFAVFVLVLAPPSAIVFRAITGTGIVATFATMAAASSLAFFGLIALQGVLLNILPARLFERVNVWAQALFATASIAGFPLAAWKSHAIASAISITWRSVAIGFFVPPVIAVLIYLLSYHRYRRLLLEAPLIRAPRRYDVLSAVLDLFIRDPRQQAAVAFIWNTIHRSRVHRLAVLVYAGLAAAWVAKSAMDMLTEAAASRDFDRIFFTFCPLVLILFTLIGLRHLFSLPADLRANWIFQLTEREGRRAWLDAVERFVLGCGVAPVVVMGAFFVVRLGGPLSAMAWAVIAFFAAAICFEYLFANWRKMPFTCSYLPGERPLVITLALYLGLLPFLLPVAWILYQSATNPASFLVMLALELAVWSRMRQSRMANWGFVPLRYEEQPESDVDSFALSDGATGAQEQFQRAWSHYVRYGPDVPLLRPLEAGETRIDRIREWLSAVPQDLRYALRMLFRNPGFAITVILTLGLGLGLNAAFFTVFNAFLLRPLAVRDPASLVSVELETRFRTALHWSWQDYKIFAADTTSGRSSAFVETAASTVEATGLDGRSAKVGLVSGNYFDMLGARTALGRPFQPDEQDAVIVLGHRAWQSRFGGDPNVVGRKVLLGGLPFEIVGITAPEFAGVPVGTVALAPREWARYGVGVPDIWVPLEVWNRLPGLYHVPVRGIVGRLRPGMNRVRAEAMITAYARRRTEDREEYDRTFRARLESLDIPITWTALQFSLPLLVAFGLTMLIPCANAANMMLARAMVRQREFGARLSLGASRGRVVRQLLTESVILTAIAGAAGVALATIVLNLFARLLYNTVPPTILFKVRIPDFEVDAHVFLYMLIVVGLTTVLFALAPAAQATRLTLTATMRGEFAGLRSSRMRDGLVIGQVAACAMLLVTAGVLVRGIGKSREIERGYESRGVYGAGNMSREDALAVKAILDRESWVETQAVMGSPLNAMDSLQVASPARSGWHSVYYNRGSGELFHLVRIGLLRGRTFTRQEAENQSPVAVASESAAKLLWPGEDPIGKTVLIQAGRKNNPRLPRFHEAMVVGVSRDIVSRVRDGGPRPALYFPDTLRSGTVLIVRGKGSPEHTHRQLEAALAASPGGAHGGRVIELQETIDWETYPQEAVSWLSTLLGGVALILTISGMYGVMSYLVSQRTKEIGVRIALGATQIQVARLVLAYSVRLAAAGLALGAVLALGVLQYTGSKIELLINLYDAPAYALSLAVVAVAALFAALAPTRRACRILPQEALRSD